jgi:nitroimidazol reductase NimA-like FMN-containing flavoprotein (pyridoxamine 5'-phosphate oxidase superfamily)
LKAVQSIPGMPRQVTEVEINDFLESKLNIQIATIDPEGYPTIHPLWFVYERASGKIYVGTRKMTKKIQNILRNPDTIYFWIDDENYPYRGVK